MYISGVKCGGKSGPFVAFAATDGTDQPIEGSELVSEIAVKRLGARSGPLQRVDALNFTTAEEVLKTAALLVVPEDQTQRQAFEKLMPHLYVLRNRGCSWAQLAKLLGECGFKLQPSTVRSYFTEMLASRLDVCQARMNEQIAIMAAVRNETAGVDLAAISGRVQAHMQQLRDSARERVDSVFGAAPATAVIEATPPARLPPVPPPRPAAARAPSPVETEHSSTEPPSTLGEFGLLGLSASADHPSQGRAGFFNLDEDVDRDADAPAAARPARAPSQRKARAASPSPSPSPSPALSVTADAAASPAPAPAPSPSTPAARPSRTGAKKVCKLQPGVPPLKRRDGVPDAVYQEGELEHPAIAGLMLTLEQRVYGAALEYFDAEGPDEGEIKTETPDEKRFRVVWRHTVPMAQTRTAHSFTKMDTALFKG
jgi:hypothetical protein